MADPIENVPQARPRAFASIQILRGLAALGVLLFHSEVVTSAVQPRAASASLFNLLFAGVDLFFVLSGFLMVWVHARDFGRPERLPLYLAKRALRIYPVYWILCCLLIPLTVYVPGFRHDGATLHAGEIVSSVLLLPHAGGRLLGVTWTLEYELLFYAAFSVFFVSRRAGWTVFTLWACAVLAAAVWGPPPLPPTGAPQFAGVLPGFLLNLHLMEFFAGMALAALLARGLRLRYPGVWLGLTALATLVGVLVTWQAGTHRLGLEQGHIRMTVVGGVFAVLVLFTALAYELRHVIHAPAWLKTLGAASYSVYLTHFLVISFFAVAVRRGFAGGLPGWLLTVLIVAFGLVPGLLLHVAAEAPLLRWTARRLASGRPRNPASD